MDFICLFVWLVHLSVWLFSYIIGRPQYYKFNSITMYLPSLNIGFIHSFIHSFIHVSNLSTGFIWLKRANKQTCKRSVSKTRTRSRLVTCHHMCHNGRLWLVVSILMLFRWEVVSWWVTIVIHLVKRYQSTSSPVSSRNVVNYNSSDHIVRHAITLLRHLPQWTTEGCPIHPHRNGPWALGFEALISFGPWTSQTVHIVEFTVRK